jgi:hypothetical protein
LQARFRMPVIEPKCAALQARWTSAFRQATAIRSDVDCPPSNQINANKR